MHRCAAPRERLAGRPTSDRREPAPLTRSGMRRTLVRLGLAGVVALGGAAAVLVVPTTSRAGKSASAFVQGSQSSGSGTSISGAFASTVQAGDLLVAMVRATGITLVSDNQNGKWIRAVAAPDGVNSL